MIKWGRPFRTLYGRRAGSRAWTSAPALFLLALLSAMAAIALLAP